MQSQSTTESAPSSSIVESSEPDYSSVDLPTDEPPEEWSYVERRADLLRQIVDLGHPSLIHQGEQAERFGVSQQQISKDLDRIAIHVRETQVADADRRALAVNAVCSRAIRGLLDDGEYRAAAKIALDWDAWAMEREDLAIIRERVAQLEDRVEDRGR